jgi:phenylacetate-coenzyme A ligase PaaK-like adenylate-forming protein
MERRLDLLAREAADRYSYYKAWRGEDLRFGDLPLVDKATLNGCRTEFESPMREEGIVTYTSGSTGTPFRCIKTKKEQLELAMGIQRSRRRAGIPLSYRSLLLGNSVLADARMTALYANQVSKQAPHLIQGRCSGLYELALYFDKTGLPIPASLQALQNWGEYVQPAQRTEMERIFGVPLLDYYGMEEIWLIAFSNGSGRLEIDEQLVYVEAIDPATGRAVPEGETGELVVTSFVMKSLPFLRYRTGDMGRILPGPSGGGPLLELLPFRVSQIKLPGRAVNASVLRYLDRFYHSLAVDMGMTQFQLVQESPALFRLLIVAEPVQASELSEAARRLELLLKQCLLLSELEIEVERVTHIEPHPVSGKCQPFVSKVL